MRKSFIPVCISKSDTEQAAQLIQNLSFQVLNAARGISFRDAGKVAQDLGQAFTRDLNRATEVFQKNRDARDSYMYFFETECGRVIDRKDSPLSDHFYLRQALEHLCEHCLREAVEMQAESCDIELREA